MIARSSAVALVALATLAAVVPAAPAAAALPRVAHFDVSISATQDIKWNIDATAPTCSGSTVKVHGYGGTQASLFSPAPQRAVAARLPNGEVRFTFANGTSYIHVAGQLRRRAHYDVTPVGPPDTGRCGGADPVPSDCGTRVYPGASRVAILYARPESWRDSDGFGPIVPSLRLRGPYSRQWLGGVRWQNCPGASNTDEQLGVNDHPTVVGPSAGPDTGYGPLSLGTIFGSRRRFEVKGGLWVPQKRPLPEGATGGSTVTTSLHWTVTFTRVGS
jgi:hypothetical protein